MQSLSTTLAGRPALKRPGYTATPHEWGLLSRVWQMSRVYPALFFSTAALAPCESGGEIDIR